MTDKLRRDGRRDGKNSRRAVSSAPVANSNATPVSGHVGTGENEAAELVDTDSVPTPASVPPLRVSARNARRKRARATRRTTGSITGPGAQRARTGPSYVSRPDAPGRFLRDRARRMMVGQGPPTVPLAGIRRQSELSAEAERAVLDIVLRLGEAMIATGAPVAETTIDMLRMADGLGVKNLTVDITFTSVTATIDREDTPITKVRVIADRTSDYSRLTEIYRLVGKVGDEKMTIADTRAELDRILNRPHPYSRLVVTLALGVMAAAIAVLLGGGWAVSLVAAVTTMIIDRVQRFLRHHQLPFLFQQTVGGAIATLVAVVLFWGRQLIDWDWSLLPPTLVVASGIVVLLAGMSVVGSAEDAIAGYPLTSSARAFEVAVATVGIIIGIGATLAIAQRLGVDLSVGDLQTGRLGGTDIYTVLAGAATAGAWAVASYTRMRIVALIALIAAGASGVYALASLAGVGPSSGPFGTAVAAFLAATVVGLVGGALAERIKVPAMVIAVCGVTPFLPGLSIYRAMYNIVDTGHLLEGLDLLVRAISIGLALAAGVALGEYFARPLTKEADKWQRRMRRRAGGSRN